MVGAGRLCGCIAFPRRTLTNNAEGEHNKAETAKISQGRNQDSREEAADAGLKVGRTEGLILDGRGCDGRAKELAEAERHEEAGKGVGKDLLAARADGLVDGIVSGIRAPARGEAVDRGGERKDAARFRLAGLEWQEAVKLSGVGELAEDNHEDDEAGYPALQAACQSSNTRISIGFGALPSVRNGARSYIQRRTRPESTARLSRCLPSPAYSGWWR